jgi:hypothetical protein
MLLDADDVKPAIAHGSKVQTEPAAQVRHGRDAAVMESLRAMLRDTPASGLLHSIDGEQELSDVRSESVSVTLSQVHLGHGCCQDGGGDVGLAATQGGDGGDWVLVRRCRIAGR